MTSNGDNNIRNELRQDENGFKSFNEITHNKEMNNTIENLLIDVHGLHGAERNDGTLLPKQVEDFNESRNENLKPLKVKRECFLASMLSSSDVNEGNDGDDEDDDENRKNPNLIQLHDKLAMSETLAQNSMLMSPAAKRRLMARKLELLMKSDELERSNNEEDYIPPMDVLMYLVRYASNLSNKQFHLFCLMLQIVKNFCVILFENLAFDMNTLAIEHVYVSYNLKSNLKFKFP